MDAKKIRPYLVFGILAMFAACVWMVWTKFSEMQPESQILKLQQQLKPETTVTEPPPVVVPEVVKRINARNQNIQSLSVAKMNVRIWEGGMRFKLDGNLYYKKDLFFRMQISSLFGTELDLGANETIFWYWSRRDKDPGLYYAHYEDYGKTRLKTPFNPVFLRVSLGLEPIQTEGTQIVTKDGFVAIVRLAKNSTGQPIIYSTFINEETEKVEGFLVTDMNNKPLASCEIQKYEGDLPKQILYTWHEEDKVLLLEFEAPVANEEIPASKWELPNRKPKINMGEEMMSVSQPNPETGEVSSK